MAFKPEKDALAELAQTSTEKEFVKKKFITDRPNAYTLNNTSKYTKDVDYVDFNDVSRVKNEIYIHINGNAGGSKYLEGTPTKWTPANGVPAIAIGSTFNDTYMSWFIICAYQTNNNFAIDIDSINGNVYGSCCIFSATNTINPEYSQIEYSSGDTNYSGGLSSLKNKMISIGSKIDIRFYNFSNIPLASQIATVGNFGINVGLPINGNGYTGYEATITEVVKNADFNLYISI